MMDKVLNNVLINDPFIKEKHHSSKPLYAALVPDEIFKGSHFERRFVTPFGGLWEKLAQVVAQENHGYCSIGHSINGVIGSERLRRIQEILNNLEHNANGETKIKPDWSKELEYIKQGAGDPIPVSVTCDIYIHNEETNSKYAFELVASDTNDFVTTKIIYAKNEDEHKKIFIDKVYKKDNYRRITKEEACLIQGFPKEYKLPESRARWMKLLGNSVSVPIIEILGKAIVDTGIFDNNDSTNKINSTEVFILPTNQNKENFEIIQDFKKTSLQHFA